MFDDKKALDLIAEVLIDFEAPYHSQIEQISLYVTGTGRSIEKKPYTVTAFVTYFVEAASEEKAKDMVYEALLGNDEYSILDSGEVHQQTIHIMEGHRHTIKHGENNGN